MQNIIELINMVKGCCSDPIHFGNNYGQFVELDHLRPSDEEKALTSQSCPELSRLNEAHMKKIISYNDLYNEKNMKIENSIYHRQIFLGVIIIFISSALFFEIIFTPFDKRQ